MLKDNYAFNLFEYIYIYTPSSTTVSFKKNNKNTKAHYFEQLNLQFVIISLLFWCFLENSMIPRVHDMFWSTV